jgi:hypothetical protein
MGPVVPLCVQYTVFLCLFVLFYLQYDPLRIDWPGAVLPPCWPPRY